MTCSHSLSAPLWPIAWQVGKNVGLHTKSQYWGVFIPPVTVGSKQMLFQSQMLRWYGLKLYKPHCVRSKRGLAPCPFGSILKEVQPEASWRQRSMDSVPAAFKASRRWLATPSQLGRLPSPLQLGCPVVPDRSTRRSPEALSESTLGYALLSSKFKLSL